MIDLLFTYDYEIYGDGGGSLYECVLKNTEKLNQIFENYNFRYVNYVEAAEFIKIKENNSDSDINLVEKQILNMYNKKYEIALHLHPQWFNSKYIDNKWILDYSEYNLCKIEVTKINEYLTKAIEYLRRVLNEPKYNPISFRAGNWLIQPTDKIVQSLLKYNIKIDSSLFKGGIFRTYGIDFRPSLKNNDYYWSFYKDVNIPEKEVRIWEIPIYAWQVPFWKSISKNKLNALKGNNGTKICTFKRVYKFFDKLSFFYPLKLDFTKMSFNELSEGILKIINEDKKSPEIYKPITLIGHSKNLIQFNAVEKLLKFISEKKINVSLFKEIIPKLNKFYRGDGISKTNKKLSSES